MIERYVYGLALQIRGMVAATEPKTMQKAVQISGALTDEAVRNGSIKKVEKRGNVGETSKDKNGLDPSDLGFRYEIKIASGQLVEIDKVIKGCKLEIEGHVFDIDLIPFGHGSFDVIIGMDWLSNYKDEIICHEKAVRIPLPDGKVLRVWRRQVFPNDLIGLPPIQKIKFQIKLIPGATPVAKSPYRLAPSELEELPYLDKFVIVLGLKDFKMILRVTATQEVIVNGDAPAIASASADTEGPIPPKTVEQKLARKNKLKAKSTLLLAIPDENLLKFHGIKDAKTLWEAIKEDANLKLLGGGGWRSYIAWNNIALIMRNKSEYTLSMDDLYNNLKVDQASSSTYADDVMFSFFANQSNSGHAYHEGEEILKEDRKELNFNGKETISFDKTKVECYNCHRRGHFARECRAPRNQRNRNRDAPRRNALAEEGIINFALMTYTSQGSSSSDFENEAVYEEDITFLKYDVQVKNIFIKDLKNQLEEALKEKDDLKLKLEKFEESSKNLTKLINSQISAKDKSGLGYESQINENEVVHGVFNSRETGEWFHAVPPPYTGNYIPLRPDLSFAGLDDSVYKTKVTETETNISKTSKDIVEKSKTVRPSAPIIEEWDTDSDNDSVFRPKSD
ncbi:ribonuclease H-like domain-containing protein [Tanacetum coccineum]